MLESVCFVKLASIIFAPSQKHRFRDDQATYTKEYVFANVIVMVLSFDIARTCQVLRWGLETSFCNLSMTEAGPQMGHRTDFVNKTGTHLSLSIYIYIYIQY